MKKILALALCLVLGGCVGEARKECYPVEDVYTINYQAGIIKVLLPSDWKRLKIPIGNGEPKSAASFIQGDGEVFSAYINITIVDLKKDLLCDTSEFKKAHLEDVKTKFKQSMPMLGFEWIGSENVELFNVPCLNFSYSDKNNRVYRETYFIKYCKLYWISFAAGDKDTFNKDLPAIDSFITSIEFE